jgi:PRTRC genetic system protein E
MSENHENPSASRPGLFAELAQLAAERTLLITVSTVDGGLLCVNFVPKRLMPSEDDALATPLCLTGTPAELDRDMVGQIRGYVAAHRALSSNLKEAQRQMDEAANLAHKKMSRAKATDSRSITRTPTESGSVGSATEVATSTDQRPLPLFEAAEGAEGSRLDTRP